MGCGCLADRERAVLSHVRSFEVLGADMNLHEMV
jgi:hypothetical protein